MTTLHTLLLVVHVIIGALIIGLVLLQRGKGAEMGAVFGSGASATVFGAKGSANFLSQLVWGSTCDGARSIKFTVQVVPSPKLRWVLLFIKLQDKYSSYFTEWGAGAILSDNEQGVYFYTIELDQIARYRTFEDAWLQYQFVALDKNREAIGRSVVSRNEVSLTHCKVFNP